MRLINPASFGRIDPANWRDVPSHFISSIWPAKLPSKPANYGSNSFPGRTHPDIVKVALERYTKPGDVVWDCFAGSGTTIDCCEEYGNICVANDVTPTRSDIVKADSMSWHPYCDVDLVIAHPPYMGIIDYQDGWLSTNDLGRYLVGMMNVFNNIDSVLKDWHVLVLIAGVVYHKQEMVCLDYHLHNLLPNYRLLGRVVRPYGETKGGATAGARNENLWRYRRIKYGIWSLNQDVILFLQKLPD
jgi:hypothetical protein